VIDLVTGRFVVELRGATDVRHDRTAKQAIGPGRCADAVQAHAREIEGVDGSIALSSALRYDAPARSLRLEQPKAERLELQGVSGADAERLQQIGGLVAQEPLQGRVLRTFTAEELSFGSKTYEIGDITVLADGIKVELK